MLYRELGKNSAPNCSNLLLLTDNVVMTEGACFSTIRSRFCQCRKRRIWVCNRSVVLWRSGPLFQVGKMCKSHFTLKTVIMWITYIGWYCLDFFSILTNLIPSNFSEKSSRFDANQVLIRVLHKFHKRTRHSYVWILLSSVYVWSSQKSTPHVLTKNQCALFLKKRAVIIMFPTKSSPVKCP